jgi:ribosome assembly protein RRB1
VSIFLCPFLSRTPNTLLSSVKPIVEFSRHSAPITSIEWHPSDASVFAASGDDSIITIWDLAVEADEDEMVTKPPSNDRFSYPQLMFDHHHEHVKEMHWHPQIPGMIISTGIGQFNVFKPVEKM